MKYASFAVAVCLLVLGLSAAARAQDQSLPYYQAGNNFYSQRNYDQAIRYYQAAAQMNPQLWQAYQGEGNCYYAKGDKASALTNYQKALAINPNNPQLSSFAQTLQAQLGTAPPAQPSTNNPAMTVSNNSPAASSAAKNFEVDPMAGIAISTSTGYGLGFGGGVGAYYSLPPDSKLAIGGSVGFYTFSNSMATTETFSPYGSRTITSNGNWTNIEILASGKMRFDAQGLKPYLLGGVGISLFGITSSGGTTYNLNPPYNQPPYTSYYQNSSSPSISGSSIYPTLQAGGGLELQMGPDMEIFAETKYSLIIGQNGTAGYEPVAIGLSFKM